jgi:ankyrin repeat protein
MAVLILILLAQSGALNWAAQHRDLALTRALLTVGANPSSPDFAGNYPLAYTVMYNRADLAELLLNHKAHVRPVELGSAIGSDYLPLVNLFMEHGASATAAHSDGRTPMHIAAVNGRTEIAASSSNTAPIQMPAMRTVRHRSMKRHGAEIVTS